MSSNDRAQQHAKIRSRLGHSHYFLHSSRGTELMLLDGFTKHLSRSTAAHISKSALRGRCGTVNDHTLLIIWTVKLLEGGEMRPGYDKASCSHSKGRGRAEEETKHVHRRKPNKRNSCPTSVSEFRDTCARGHSAGAFQAWSPKFLSGKQKLVAQTNLSASKLETLQNLWHHGKRQKVCLCCWQVANPLSLLNQTHIQTSTLKSSRMSSYSALLSDEHLPQLNSGASGQSIPCAQLHFFFPAKGPPMSHVRLLSALRK